MPNFFKLNQKGLVHLIPLFIILIGIIAGVYLVQKSGFQIFKSKAAAKTVEILNGECVKSSGGNKVLTCERFQFKVTSPLEANQ